MFRPSPLILRDWIAEVLGASRSALTGLPARTMEERYLITCVWFVDLTRRYKTSNVFPTANSTKNWLMENVCVFLDISSLLGIVCSDAESMKFGKTINVNANLILPKLMVYAGNAQLTQQFCQVQKCAPV